MYLFLGACSNLPEITTPVGHTYYVTVNTKNGPVKMFVRDEGQGDPIVLLHGFGSNLFTWRYLYPDLINKHRVLAIDLKGFGASDKPLDEEYSAFHQGELIRKLIKKLKLKNITLVGHSYGGGVAIATLFKNRAKGNHNIKRMVIMDGLAYKQPIPFFLRMMRTPVISQIGMALVPPSVHARASLSYSYKDKKRITDEAVKNYARPYYSPNSLYAAKKTAEQILPKNLDAYTTLYPTIDIPTLLIWCRHDRVIPLINAFKLNSALPNSELEILGNCGHMPQEEMPTETVNAMLNFLKKNKIVKKRKGK